MNELLVTDRTLELKIRTSYELKYNFFTSDGVTIPNLGHLFHFAPDEKTSSNSRRDNDVNQHGIFSNTIHGTLRWEFFF